MNRIAASACYPEATASGGLCKLPNYRLYRIDGAGKITAAEWLEAADDDSARLDAKQRNGHGSFELWDKERLVERHRMAPPPQA